MSMERISPMVNWPDDFLTIRLGYQTDSPSVWS